MLATILFGDLPLGQQELEDFLYPQFEKKFRGQLGQRHEGSFLQEHAFRDQRMKVRMPMDQAPKSLNGSDHRRHRRRSD